MTLRRLWLLILVSVSIVAIAVNAMILTLLTDRYFSDYLKESYELHVEQIINYTTSALTSDVISFDQMAMELESHLNDPIIAIKIYDPNGKLLVAVDSDYHMDSSSMHSMIGGRMMTQRLDETTEQVNQIEIISDGQVIAIMNITLHSIAENSFIARRFNDALLTNSLYSVAIAIGMALVVGIIISRKMSKSLKETEKLASDIQLGEDTYFEPSSLTEVNSIRESLLELNARLKMKQKTRKSLIDQLVHQTRTPLTILKSNIEAMEDGVIELNGKALQICQDQISEVTSIISNMSTMIDADHDFDDIQIDTFNFANMLKQIKQGLVAQFLNKNIKLEVFTNQSVSLVTDKYKLSQAIYNILTNAYKYTNENGDVRINYHTADDRLIVKIQDSGMGISKDEKERIFNAYYRSPDAAEEKGDGLGLFIAKENIRRIHGWIDVESEIGVGSVFTINIPLKLGERG